MCILTLDSLTVDCRAAERLMSLHGAQQSCSISTVS